MGSLFLKRLGPDYSDAVKEGFEAIGLLPRLSASTRVAVKPNLTFPTFRPGVMTNPAALEAVVRYLLDLTPHVTICESDSGGYNPFSITEVFERTGIAALAKSLGVRLVNMTREPARVVKWRSGIRQFHVPLPRLLLEETDVFVTMPVPKVHLNTVVSLGVKNQWGVIQKPSLRLKLHPQFARVVYQINKILPTPIVVLDGRYGLNRSGPMRGDAEELGWWVVGDNVFETDVFVCQLMGLRPHRIPYLRYCMQRERINAGAAPKLVGNSDDLTPHKFYLRREWTDLPGLIAFRSRMAAYLGYESFLARPLHWLLYQFREPFY